ncbi:cysteine dioxygenase family protein [Paracandidimonas lactea]|uniref:cysteine dioxygenase family protein n=1 Tax=Paracandidimonas lactea TaxID=2895524 RepID=UPI001F23F61E|nr:cysteine dioxygenase family protein [Paracandidimonas lactea]
MHNPDEKRQAISGFIETAKQQTAGKVTRPALDVVLEALKGIAAHRDWWSAAEYPSPEGDELQARYLIHEEPDNSYALYLNVMKPGKKIVPHNHTTWACIAAVEGTESNYLYERTDDGRQPGCATLRETGMKKIGPGAGIALLADDIHAVRIEDDSIRHLHMYGLALEKLDRRLAFDMETGTCKVMPVGVQTRRSTAQ